MKIYHHNKAFVSLFTVLLATVILSIAVGMTSIALKQIVLASTADDANEAFYSADSGMQCAIMLDLDETMDYFGIGNPGSANCGSAQSIPINNDQSGMFSLGQGGGFEWSNGNCVKITVDKSTSNMTKIEALGYNVSCSEIGSPKTVERALRVRYAGN